MDDDPEPSLDEAVLGSCEVSEQSFSVAELQKCTLEDEVNIHQEGGDNGPFMDQEPTKKPLLGKDVPDQALQTENKGGIFRRKDQSQAPDVSGSIKSSASSLRKPSRRSIPRLPGQESRRSSQQSVGVQSPLSLNPSRTQSISESDAKEITWVSKRTGKLMKCRTQQTSLIWEQKSFSDIFSNSSDESDRSREGSMETLNTVDESEMMYSEEVSLQESLGSKGCHSSQQLEGKGSKRNSLKRDSRRNSQRSMEIPLLLPKGICLDEDISWISPKTGKEMKCKAQQTSVVWELKTLSEILHTSSQESFPNALETDTTELSSETETEQRGRRGSQRTVQRPESRPPMGQESRRGSLVPEAVKSRQDTQKLEEQKPTPYRNAKMDTFMSEQAQQTDSCESLKEELLPHSQQRDALVGAQVVSHRSSLREDAQIPQPANQELVWEESQPSIPTAVDFQRGHSLPHQGFGKDVGVGKESNMPAGLQSRVTEATQEPPLEQGTWISKRTGKVVKNRSQQTDKSWLQYCAAKRQKVKKCTSQQTDESFLQSYAERKMKKASRESMPAARDQQEQPRTGVASTMRRNEDPRGFLLHGSYSLSPQNEPCGAEMVKEGNRAEAVREGSRAEVMKEVGRAEEGSRAEMVKEGSRAEVMKDGGREDVVKEGGRAEGVKEGSRAEMVKEGSRADVVKDGGRADVVKEAGPAEVVKDGGRPDVVKEAGPAEVVKDGGRADVVKEAGPAEVVKDGGRADVVKEAGPAEVVKDGGRPDVVKEAGPAEVVKEGGRADVVKEAGPAEVVKEGSRQSSHEDGKGPLLLHTVKDPPNSKLVRSSLQWPDDSEPKSYMENGMPYSYYMEGEDDQIYSIISLEDGIWMNRRTGKLVVSHFQQTGKTAVPTISRTSLLGKGGNSGRAFGAPGSGSDGARSDQEESEREEAPSGQESHRGSHQDSDRDASLIIVKPTGGESQCADDVEKLLSRRLSEAMLLSVESPDVGDETALYTAVSVEKGSWVNLKTGQLLESHSQQTEEEHIDQVLVEDVELSSEGVSQQQAPGEGPVGFPEPSHHNMQGFGREGPVGFPEPSHHNMQGFGREGPVGFPEPSHNKMQGLGRDGPVGFPEPSHHNMQGLGREGPVGFPEPSHHNMQGFGRDGPVGFPEPSHHNMQGFGRDGPVGFPEPSHHNMQGFGREGPVGFPEPSHNKTQGLGRDGPVGFPEPSHHNMQGLGREGPVGFPEPSHNKTQGLGRDGPVGFPESSHDNTQGYGAEGMDDDPISRDEQPSPAGRG
uniref:uncharacterized protein LOC114590935 n=1 Tax=Podarcis muralis TaxID=64176 RepID=UPI00109F38B0|nr:uncharacterized protein LOC114590935 [Podarcis muralis]